MKKLTALICLLILLSLSAAAQETDGELEARIAELEKTVEALQEEVEEAKTLPEPIPFEFSGEATLAWEMGLETGGTGFENKYEIKMKVPLARGTETKRAGDNLKSQVSLFKFELALDDEGVGINEGKIEAKLLWDKYFLILSSNPDFLLDMAVPVDDPNINVRTNKVVSTAGFSFGTEGRGSKLEFKVGSADTGMYNAYNKYSFGVEYARRVIKNFLSIEGAVSYGTTIGALREDIPFASKDVGFSFSPVFTIGSILHGLKVQPAVDFTLPYDGVEYVDSRYDLMLDTELKLSDRGTAEDGSDAWTMLGLTAYSIPGEEVLDLGVTLKEVIGDDGLIPVLGADLAFGVYNLMHPDEIYYGTNGAVMANIGPVVPFVDYVYAVDAVRTLTYQEDTGSSQYIYTLGMGVGAKLKLMEEKLILLGEYRSLDLNHYDGDMGELKFAVTLKY